MLAFGVFFSAQFLDVFLNSRHPFYPTVTIRRCSQKSSYSVLHEVPKSLNAVDPSERLPSSFACLKILVEAARP